MTEVAENLQYIPGLEAGTTESGEIQIDGASLCHIPAPSVDTSFLLETIERAEILDYGNQCFLLKHVLTDIECQHFIEKGEKLGFEEIRMSDKVRSSSRISFQSPELASLLWERIKGHVEEVEIDSDPKLLHIEGPPFLMQGKWQPIGLNNVFRLCRYYPGGHFAPHNDGFFAVSTTERSLKTFMLYLNGSFQGGSTNFIDPAQNLFMGPDGKYCAEEKNILYRVQPESGLAIVFNHNRLHEGQRLQDGVKYILRTDIMYRNVTPRPMSSNEDKAMELMQQADRLEAQGECMAAMELYRKAFKLFPELENSLGL